MTLAMLFFFITHLCALIAAGQALLTKKDPRSALGWTAVLVFLPVIGLVLYLIFGISRAQSRAERMMRKIAVISRHYSSLPTSAIPAQHTGEEAGELEKLGLRITDEPLCGGNSVIPYHNGDEAYPAMLQAITRARDHVFLSTYIFNYGVVARAFICALEDAHKRGVDVRVLVDGIGALYSWHKPWKILAKSGIKTHLFRPPSLFPPNFGINLRSHRKALICDGVAFSGGMNIADGDVADLEAFERRVDQILPNCYSAHLPPSPKGAEQKIQDVQFRFEGPIVNEICKAFLLNWSFCDKRISELPPSPETVAGSCDCRVIVDGPGDDADALNDLICGAIDLARSRVRIMTPYFLPPANLIGSLRLAALRGVDVRVALPAKNNLDYVNWASQRILPSLLKAGVRVWYQPPPFAHTKLLVVDGLFSLIGSANLDNRSLRLNFEMNVSIYDSTLADNLAGFMDATMNRGREIVLHRLQSLGLPARLRNSLCWIFSPYL